MPRQEQSVPAIILSVGEDKFGFKVPGHSEIKFYYDTGAESLYDASRNLILVCADDRPALEKLIDAKPAIVPQIAVNLLRVAGSGIEVKLENFPQGAAGS